MCLDNAIETLSLALEFKFDGLNKSVVEFIGKTIKTIPRDKLSETAVEKPLVFNEIFKHCVTKFGQKLNSLEACRFHTQSQLSIQLASPDSDFSRDYEETFESQLFTDIDLEVDGKILKAHKIVLSSEIYPIF